MKIIFLLLCVLFVFQSNLFAIPDTLRFWDKTKTQFVYYDKFNDGSRIIAQVARFPMKAPATIKSVTVYLTGGTGTAQIYILGHQAGEHLPTMGLYGKDVIASTNLNKTQSGVQTFTVNLPPDTKFPQNQMWVMLANMTNGIFLLSDNTPLPVACSAGAAGGDYYYQVLYNAQGQPAVGGSGFLIDVAVDYPTLTSPQFFKDATASLGIPTNISNYTIAFGDYDSDGFQDMLVSGKLFHNESGKSFTDATQTAGLTATPQGNAFADFDNDGDLDILFLFSQKDNAPKSILYENNGAGQFTAKTLAIPQLKGLSSFSIADINNDKLPDIFIGQLWSEYPATGPDLLPSFLLFNNGKNDFTDNTSALTNRVSKRSRGSEWVDFDNDGDLDLFITNYLLEHDELWQNDGTGKFTNVIDEKGIEQLVQAPYYNHGTGCDWADYDNDGDMDLLLSQFMHPANAANGFEGTSVYKNEGAPNYNFQSSWDKQLWKDKSGIAFEETHTGGSFGDVNNDGLPDIILPVYYGCRFADFYLQKADNTFENATFDWGLEGITSGEDASFADFNNDGKLDLAFANAGQFRLYQNDAPKVNNYITIDLKSTSANQKGIGSRVIVFAGNKKYMQEVTAGRGQRMQKPTRLHFGLANATQIDSVQVRWIGKKSFETFKNVLVNTNNLLEEGKGNITSVLEQTNSFANGSWLAEPNPNPTNTLNNIKFGIDKDESISIDLISNTGKLITNIYQKENVAAGEYNLNLGNLQISSGVYYIQLTAGADVITKKVVVVK